MVIDVPTMTAEHYDVIAARLGWVGRDAVPPSGLVVHIAGPTPDGWRIIDIWRDEQAFEQFSSSAVASAVKDLGLPPYEPQVVPIHHALGMVRHREGA